MSRASESELGLLHGAVAKFLRTKLEGEDATASDVTNALKMLKDNNITCTADENSELSELEKALEKRSAMVPDETDLSAALEQLKFTDQKVN